MFPPGTRHPAAGVTRLDLLLHRGCHSFSTADTCFTTSWALQHLKSYTTHLNARHPHAAATSAESRWYACLVRPYHFMSFHVAGDNVIRLAG